MDKQQNAAYDLSMFDTKPTEELNEDLKVRTLRVIKRKRRVNSVAPYKIILSVILALTVTISMIYSRVVVMELTAEITSYNAEMRVLESEFVRLSSELEAGSSMKTLEQSAVDSLGLTKIDSSQVEYINLAQGDEIEVAKVGGGFKFSQWWNGIISTLEEYIAA